MVYIYFYQVKECFFRTKENSLYYARSVMEYASLPEFRKQIYSKIAYNVCKQRRKQDRTRRN